MLPMDTNEILTHLGEDRQKYFNAVAPPIIQTSNFVYDSVEALRNAITDELNNHVYTRGNNPTVEILRKKVAALEHAEDALITSSGASAVSIAVISQVKAGDHIICVNKPYSWTYKLVANLLAKFGVEYTFVDGTEIDNIRNAIQPNTTLLYLESPNSLTFELQDLEACAALAQEHNITTIIDNSHCSPLFQNPIDYGIDLVIHSGTKYINGHSDVVMGVICGSKHLINEIFKSEFMTLGVNVSPHDAALAIRGLRTMNMRVNKSDKSCKQIVDFLKPHPKVKSVIYTLDPNFPQYELAKKQMKGNGGLFTLILNVDSKEEVYTFVNNINRFLIAVSWGVYESLMIPSITFHDMPGVPDSPIPWTYIRFYVGIEDAEFLIEDLQNALNSIS